MAKGIKSLDYIKKKLNATYKSKRTCKRRDLVETIAIQALTPYLSDTRLDKVVGKLKSEFVDWNDVRISRPFHILDILGLTTEYLDNVKLMKRSLQTVFNDFGRLSDDIMTEQTEIAIRKYFGKIYHNDFDGPGVIMMEGLGLSIIPIGMGDLIFFKRFGAISVKMTKRQLQRLLGSVLKPDDIAGLHYDLQKHIRTSCLKEVPRCSKCAMKQKCKQQDVEEYE